jgi:L-iditol 2-dehydrogenase
MKAILLSAPGQLEYVDLPEPTIDAVDDVILAIRGASVCGSDTHGYSIGAGGRRIPPLVMGHEACGTVEAVGAAAAKVLPGQRVFMMPMEACQHCRACIAGTPDACTSRKVYGADLPGAFAERMRIASRSAIPIPDSVSFLQGSLIEPLSVVVKGLSRTAVQPGDTLAVVGGGPIGLLATAVLKLHRPRHLIVVEPNRVRRELAQSLGATATIDPTAGDAADQIRELTEGDGVDLAVEAVGVTETVGVAVRAIRAGGAMVWLGNAGRMVEIDEFNVVWKQLTIYASVGVTRASVDRAISLIASGAVPVERLITSAVPLAEGVAAFYRQASDPDVVKTVLIP